MGVHNVSRLRRRQRFGRICLFHILFYLRLELILFWIVASHNWPKKLCLLQLFQLNFYLDVGEEDRTLQHFFQLLINNDGFSDETYHILAQNVFWWCVNKRLCCFFVLLRLLHPFEFFLEVLNGLTYTLWEGIKLSKTKLSVALEKSRNIFLSYLFQAFEDDI